MARTEGKVNDLETMQLCRPGSGVPSPPPFISLLVPCPFRSLSGPSETISRASGKPTGSLLHGHITVEGHAKRFGYRSALSPQTVEESSFQGKLR